uniref:Uncharacterized protein n=1 Tax=Solanum tuberosum TaxID=4113 RepID=M1DP58_SOLTU
MRFSSRECTIVPLPHTQLERMSGLRQRLFFMWQVPCDSKGVGSGHDMYDDLEDFEGAMVLTTTEASPWDTSSVGSRGAKD